MIIQSINFTPIKRMIDAAEALQEAGKDNDARRVLVQLANDIINKVSKVK